MKNIFTLLKIALIIQIILVLNTYQNKLSVEKNLINLQIQELENKPQFPIDFELPELIIRN